MKIARALRHATVCLCLLASANLRAELQTMPVVRIAVQEGTPYASQPIKAVVAEAYRRINHKAEFSPDLPLARAAVAVDSGDYDGALAGSAGAQAKYPNVVAGTVPVLWLDYEVLGISEKPESSLNSWAELKKSSLSIAGRLNYILLNNRLGERRYTHVTSEKSVLLMLQAGRVDVAVMSHQAYAWVLAEHPELANSAAKIRRLATLERAPLFHYVHAKNAHLLPALDKALQEMERDGTMARLWRLSATPQVN